MDDKARIRSHCTASSAAGCSMPPIHCGRPRGVDPAGGFFERLARTASRSPSRAVRASRRARPTASRWAVARLERRCRGARQTRSRLLVREVTSAPMDCFARSSTPMVRSLDDRALTLRPGFRAARVQSRRDSSATGARERERQALELLQAGVEAHLKRATGGFENGVPASLPLNRIRTCTCSKPRWQVARCARKANLWNPLADEIAEFALAHFFDPAMARCASSSTTNWNPAAGRPGAHRRARAPVRMGLAAAALGRRQTSASARAAALKLIEISEAHGVRNGLATATACSTISPPHDAGARLWPQTERLKAARIGRAPDGRGEIFFHGGASAAESLHALSRHCPIPGLWYDRIDVEGQHRRRARARQQLLPPGRRDRGNQRARAPCLNSVSTRIDSADC